MYDYRIGRSTGYKTSELETLTDGQMLVIGGKEIEVMSVACCKCGRKVIVFIVKFARFNIRLLHEASTLFELTIALSNCFGFHIRKEVQTKFMFGAGGGLQA